MAYNNTRQASIKVSPALAVYGRELRTPMGLIVNGSFDFKSVKKGAFKITDDEKALYADRLMSRLEQIWGFIRKNAKESKRKMKERVDQQANVTETSFQIGDAVMLKSTATPPKATGIAGLHHGPAIIKEKKGPNCHIRYRDGRGIIATKEVHVTQLKRYRGTVTDKELLTDIPCGMCGFYDLPTQTNYQVVAWVQCDQCKVWFHRFCLDERRIRVRFLERDCPNCHPSRSIAEEEDVDSDASGEF